MAEQCQDTAAWQESVCSHWCNELVDRGHLMNARPDEHVGSALVVNRRKGTILLWFCSVEVLVVWPWPEATGFATGLFVTVAQSRRWFSREVVFASWESPDRWSTVCLRAHHDSAKAPHMCLQTVGNCSAKSDMQPATGHCRCLSSFAEFAI